MTFWAVQTNTWLFTVDVTKSGKQNYSFLQKYFASRHGIANVNWSLRVAYVVDHIIWLLWLLPTHFILYLIHRRSDITDQIAAIFMISFVMRHRQYLLCVLRASIMVY